MRGLIAAVGGFTAVWHDDDVAAGLLLGIGMAAHLPCDEALALADGHPAVNPGFQLRVAVTDGVVTSAEPLVGLMHRSAEKLFEVRDYRQAMLLANRHDWLSSFASEVGIALTLEQALGITPPERATWIRTLLVEASRVVATLAFLAPVAGPARVRVDEVRERFVAAQERVTGGRVHPGYARIGGVAAPLDHEGAETYRAALTDLRTAMTQAVEAVMTYAASFSGVAALTREDVVGLGVAGPVGRASGLALDLRRDDPGLAYGPLRDLVDVVTATDGDVPARYACLLGQLPVSSALMHACLDELTRLGAGPVDVPLPKVVRLPEGTTYTWLEGPLGVTGALVVSTGDKTPWRMKIRSASFATMQALGPALVGTPYAQLADAVMSFPMVIGDVDR